MYMLLSMRNASYESTTVEEKFKSKVINNSAIVAPACALLSDCKIILTSKMEGENR